MTESSSLQEDAVFQQCLEWSGGSYEVTLVAAVCEDMVKTTASHLKSEGYKAARDFALTACIPADATDDEAQAYKDFLDRYFNRKAVAGTKRKHRPRTPITAYEGDKH